MPGEKISAKTAKWQLTLVRDIKTSMFLVKRLDNAFAAGN
jgi:hypothetical protein